MSFYSELKRRNVFRVAIAYLAGAWLLIEVAGTVFPGFGIPAWAFRFVVILLALGFIPTLIFSWAYEITPEGVKREKNVVRDDSITHLTAKRLDGITIGLIVVALAFIMADRVWLSPRLAVQPAPETEVVADNVQASEPEPQDPLNSIAVLPFVNMSPDPNQEYFADGLSDDLLNLLAKIPELKVIARTSSFAFKGKDEDIRVIGQTLGVKTVLEGSVRKSGEQLRVTAQLIDVSDGSHIWSETYERTMTDIFAVQDDVAAAIIGALQLHVGANPTRGRPTENTEAYALFLRAKALLRDNRTNASKKILLDAIELDPEFAEAFEELAYIHSVQIEQQRAYEAAAKALAINPDLVFAQAMYESTNPDTYSYLGWIEAFERALRQRPGDTRILFVLAWDLLQTGYLREALGFAERYVDLDPLSSLANSMLFSTLYAVGRTNEAFAALEVAEQLNPDIVNWAIGRVNLAEKKDEIAIAHFEAGAEQYGVPSNWIRELVTGARDPVTGQAYLDRRIPQILASMPEEDAHYWQNILADWYLYFGFLDRYFESILDLDLSDSSWTDGDVPVFGGTMFRRLGFTAHPKYLEVAESIGMIEVWEQRGPPDFCEKVSGQWVCE